MLFSCCIFAHTKHTLNVVLKTALCVALYYHLVVVYAWTVCLLLLLTTTTAAAAAAATKASNSVSCTARDTLRWICCLSFSYENYIENVFETKKKKKEIRACVNLFFFKIFASQVSWCWNLAAVRSKF